MEHLCVHTVCEFCGTRIDTNYILMGVDVECASCGKRTIPRVEAGTFYPVIQYEIKFSDFKRLLSDRDYSRSIAPLIRRWFGFELEAMGESARIMSGSGAEIDMLSLHRQIQADSAMQYTLYQAAMDLWR